MPSPKGILRCKLNDKWNTIVVNDNVYVDWPGALNGVLSFNQKEVHLTLEDAQNRVGEMIYAKRKSIEKQLKKLEGYNYNKVTDVGKVDR